MCCVFYWTEASFKLCLSWGFVYRETGNSRRLHPPLALHDQSKGQGQQGSLGWIMLVKINIFMFLCPLSCFTSMPWVTWVSPGFPPEVHIQLDLLCVNVSSVFYCCTHTNEIRQNTCPEVPCVFCVDASVWVKYQAKKKSFSAHKSWSKTDHKHLWTDVKQQYN